MAAVSTKDVDRLYRRHGGTLSTASQPFGFKPRNCRRWQPHTMGSKCGQLFFDRFGSGHVWQKDYCRKRDFLGVVAPVCTRCT